MGKSKRKRVAAVRPKPLANTDMRRKAVQAKLETKEAAVEKSKIRVFEETPSALFGVYNSQLGPPYRVLIDTNFINFSIKNKIDLISGLMDCLLAKAIPCVTDCVVAELEKLGSKYRIALRIATDRRVQRLSCSHKGTYADNCLVKRVKQHKCYIVATMDRDLKRRIRRVPGVPIMYIFQHKYSIERMPDVNNAPIM